MTHHYVDPLNQEDGMRTSSTIIQPLTVGTVQAIRQDCHRALYAPPQQPVELVNLVRRLGQYVGLLRPRVAALVREELRDGQELTGLLIVARAREVLDVTGSRVPLWERGNDLAVCVRALLNMLQINGKLPDSVSDDAVRGVREGDGQS